MPKVSTVIPLYNKAPHIQRALESVLIQTYQDVEVVVIDDGSTDGGAEIVKSISDSRIRLIQQKNAGVSVARNRGIQEAQAGLIAFLDADDAWKPKFLETILRLRNRFPEAGIYATAYEFHEPNGKTVQPRYKAIPPAPWEGLIPNYFRASLGIPPVWSSAVAVPRRIFKEAGYFPAGERLGEDGDMWLRIAVKYPVAFSWQIGATYFRNASNRACNKYLMQSEYRLVKTAKELIRKNEVPAFMLPDLQEYIAMYVLLAAAQCVLAGKPQKARQMLEDCTTKCFCTQKLWWRFWASIPVPITHFAWNVKRTLFKSIPKTIEGRITIGRLTNFLAALFVLQ
ncbi:MAG: glycosyltransferase family 2 protein [bacterium]